MLVTIIASDVRSEWVKAVRDRIQSAHDQSNMSVSVLSTALDPLDPKIGSLILLDHEHPAAEGIAQALRAHAKRVTAVMGPNVKSVDWSLYDDVLSVPLRPLDLDAALRRAEEAQVLSRLGDLAGSVGALTEKLAEDLAIAERIRKARLPARIEGIKGFQIASRYFAGLAPGGDFFDVIEDPSLSAFTLFMTDASTRGVAGQIIPLLMRLAAKTTDGVAEAVAAVEAETDKILIKGRALSLFVGRMKRKELSFEYVLRGNIDGFYMPALHPEMCHQLKRAGEALTAQSGATSHEHQTLTLGPSDRIVVISDGAVEVLGGRAALEDFLVQTRSHDPVDTVSEFAFRAKTQFGDELAPQDASLFIMDVNARALRLTR